MMSVSAIALGIAALILASGFIQWNLWFGRESTIHSQLGHIRMHKPGYLDGCPPVREQTQQVLARIDALLAEAGTSKSRLLTAQVLLADVAEFDEMNAVWERWIDPAHPPARTTCGAVLAHPNVRVEITVTAAL